MKILVTIDDDDFPFHEACSAILMGLDAYDIAGEVNEIKEPEVCNWKVSIDTKPLETTWIILNRTKQQAIKEAMHEAEACYPSFNWSITKEKV